MWHLPQGPWTRSHHQGSLQGPTWGDHLGAAPPGLIRSTGHRVHRRRPSRQPPEPPLQRPPMEPMNRDVCLFVSRSPSKEECPTEATQEFFLWWLPPMTTGWCQKGGHSTQHTPSAYHTPCPNTINRIKTSTPGQIFLCPTKTKHQPHRHPIPSPAIVNYVFWKAR